MRRQLMRQKAESTIYYPFNLNFLPKLRQYLVDDLFSQCSLIKQWRTSVEELSANSLRTSSFQGATTSPIFQRQTLLFLLFTKSSSARQKLSIARPRKISGQIVLVGENTSFKWVQVCFLFQILHSVCEKVSSRRNFFSVYRGKIKGLEAIFRLILSPEI